MTGKKNHLMWNKQTEDDPVLLTGDKSDIFQSEKELLLRPVSAESRLIRAAMVMLISNMEDRMWGQCSNRKNVLPTLWVWDHCFNLPANQHYQRLKLSTKMELHAAGQVVPLWLFEWIALGRRWGDNVSFSSELQSMMGSLARAEEGLCGLNE